MRLQAEESLREEEMVVLDQILMAERVGIRVNSAVAESNLFKMECIRVGKLVDCLMRLMLHDLVGCISAASPPLYDRPIVRIVAQVSKNLEGALTLVQTCKHGALFRRFVIVSTTDFFRIFTLLESSIADVNWLLGLFDPEIGCAAGEPDLSLPPIAIHDPVISWVWSFIATLKKSPLKNRIEAANNLALLAQGNKRNKRIIEEEGGIPPLLKLLKEVFRPEAQIAAANALYILSDNQERVRSIITGGGIPIIVHLLRASPIRVQNQAARLVSRLAEKYPKAQAAFAEEHVVVPLMKLLSFELFSDEPITQFKHKQSIHSVVETKMGIDKHSSVGLNPGNYGRYTNLLLNWFLERGNRAKRQKKECETDTPELKLQLKLNCSKALWVLARANESIRKYITERNGLMCLAKLMEKETDELQLNCLMIIREITAAAEQQANCRRLAFKTNLPGVRALVNELLRVIKESEDSELKIQAIRSIGSLARIFPARETRVIESLVAQIGSNQHEVAEEAVIALQKFVCEDNFLRLEHSKSIIELNGVAALTRLIERASKQAIVLLRYLEDGQTLERYLHTKTEENIGSARRRGMTPENPPNPFENLTNSKASSIGPNMETKWPTPKSKAEFPNDLIRFATVIGPCRCSCSGLPSILAKLKVIVDFQAFGADNLASWFSSLFATGEHILKIGWRGITLIVEYLQVSLQTPYPSKSNTTCDYWWRGVTKIQTVRRRINHYKWYIY